MQRVISRSRASIGLTASCYHASRYLASAPPGPIVDAAEKARQRAAARRAARSGEADAPILPPSLSLARPRNRDPGEDVGSSIGSANTDRLGAALSAGAVDTTQPVVAGAGREMVLSPPALVVTREYEWGNIVFGFEQANRYACIFRLPQDSPPFVHPDHGWHVML